MSSEKILDFGKKVGGARKDLRGNVTRDDILKMTPEERLKLINKDTVWPVPNYEQLVNEGGYLIKAAAAVKMLRDSFPPKPSYRPDSNDAQIEEASLAYTELLNAAKSVVSLGKTPTDLAQAFTSSVDAREFLCEIVTDAMPSGYKRSSTRPGPRFTKLSHTAFNGSYSVGRDILDACANFGTGQLNRKASRLLSRNPAWPKKDSRADIWLKEQRVSVGVDDGSWKILSYGTPLNVGSGTRRLLEAVGKSEMLTATYTSQEEAETAMQELGEAVIAGRAQEAKNRREALLRRAKGTPQEGDTPQSHLIQRCGPDFCGNALITGEDYLADFGMRGGEFGNWLNQAERQSVLNKGYESFHDLAEIIGLPPEAASLGGELSIAFGARGNGHAAAHYEPARRVINLTKPHGAGSLAHEYAHALDHYLGIKAREKGFVSTLHRPDLGFFLSNSVLTRPSFDHVPDEQEKLIRDFSAAMRNIYSNNSPKTKAEMEAVAKDTKARAMAYLFVVVSNVGHDLSDPAAKSAYTAALAKVREDSPKDELSALNNFHRSLSELPGLRSRWKVDLSRYHHFAAKSVADHDAARALPDGWVGDSNSRSREYMKACRELDKDRKDPYYQNPEEMFARTFEAVVFDRMKAKGRMNPFLVDSTSGEAFPKGHERALHEQSFVPLLGRVRELLPVLPRMAELRTAAPQMAVAPTGISKPQEQMALF